MIARSAIRQRISAAIAAVDGIDPGRAAAVPFRDPQERRHGAFSVECEGSEPMTRDQPSLLLTTRYRISVSWKIRPKDQLGSYDDALDAQEQVCKAVQGMAQTSIAFSLIRLGEPVVDPAGEYLRFDLAFAASHTSDVI